MNNNEWKMQVTSSLAELRTDIKYIKKYMPKCEREAIKNSIKLNRRLIFVMLMTYIPLLVYFFISK